MTDADVYRDPHGVPHIEASSETAAWYALGFEEARDALLLIQVSAKRVRGQAVKYLSDLQEFPAIENRLLTDMLVQILGTYPQHHSAAELRTMFDTPSVPGANFYDNCVAFAAGVNAYRELVANATAPGPELSLKTWLDAVPFNFAAANQADLSWVYTEPVDALDFLWYGRWTNAYLAANFARSKGAQINSVGASFADDPGDGLVNLDGLEMGSTDFSSSELIEPESDGSGLKRLEDLKKLFAGMPGMGSNAFCWTKDYCQEVVSGTNVKYSGLMADPHDGNFSGVLGPYFHFLDQVLHLEPMGVHTWFAHVKVTPPGASAPTLDAFGTIPHGMATFFTAHNQNLAWGGTLGAPNWADAFLLRLAEGPEGKPPAEDHTDYYDYYRDPDGSDGAQTSDWSMLQRHECHIQRASGGVTVVPYWRAGTFGFVLPDMAIAAAYVKNPILEAPRLPVVYGEFPSNPSTGRHWRYRDGDRKMRYWGETSTSLMDTRDPMVVALRVPLDAAVNGATFHMMFPRDAWEFAHQDSVVDILTRINQQAASYFVNFCCVDRSGATMSTMLGAIPKRGAYTVGQTTPMAYGPQGVHAYPDLWRIYSGKLGPVPARMAEDRVFDWRYGSYSGLGYPVAGSLQFLDLTTNGSDPSYKAKFFFDGSSAGFPGATENQTGSPAQWWVDNAGFLSACNSPPWQASKKAAWPSTSSTRPNHFNNTDGDNPVFQAVLESGTLYQVSAVAGESPDRNQKVIDRLTDIARAYSGRSLIQGAAQAPMSVAEAKWFAVDPFLYVADEYQDATVADLPTAIRVQKEILNHIGVGGTSQASNGWPREEADREARFFHDLWDVVVNPLNRTTPAHQYWGSFVPPGAPSGLTLKQLWVDNAYQDPSASVPEARHVMWYDLPATTNPPRWIEMPDGFALIDFQWDRSQIGAGQYVSFSGSGTSGLDASTLLAFQGLVQTLESWNGAAAGLKFQMDPGSEAAGLYELWRMMFSQDRQWQALENGLPTPYRNASWAGFYYTAFPLEQLLSARETWSGAKIEDEVYEALYYDTANFSIRDASLQTRVLTQQHLNAITKFFLQLGDFFVARSDINNNGNPSRKMARYMLAKARAGGDLFQAREEMLATYPATYPLTANLGRMTVPRRLVEAGLRQAGPQGRRLQDHFGMRSCSYLDQAKWPQAAFPWASPAWSGQMRDVHWFTDLLAFPLQRYVHIGASNHPLLTLFPDNGAAPRSFFWANPGVRLFWPSDPSYSALLPGMANNQLTESFYPTASYHQPQYFFTSHVYVP